MATIQDNRTDGATKPCAWGFVLFTDKFLSGWGPAEQGRALYALEVASEAEAYTVMENAARRGDMKRPRTFRDIQRLRRTARGKDHLTISDRACAERWYQPRGF